MALELTCCQVVAKFLGEDYGRGLLARNHNSYSPRPLRAKHMAETNVFQPVVVWGRDRAERLAIPFNCALHRSYSAYMYTHVRCRISTYIKSWMHPPTYTISTTRWPEGPSLQKQWGHPGCLIRKKHIICSMYNMRCMSTLRY